MSKSTSTMPASVEELKRLRTGSRVKKMRVKQDMTQKEFSMLLGISPGYLSAIELGKRELPVFVADELHRLTGASYDYIYEGTELYERVYSDYLMESSHSRESSFQKMVVALKTCTPEELNGCYEICNAFLRATRRTAPISKPKEK